MKTLTDMLENISNWEGAELNELLDSYIEYAIIHQYEEGDTLTDFEDI